MPPNLTRARWSSAGLLVVGVTAGVAGFFLGSSLFAHRPRAEAAADGRGALQPAATGPRGIALAPQDGNLASVGSGTEVPAADLPAGVRTPRSERALAEGNWRLRASLRNAVLREWARTAPQAAGDWAMALRDDNREEAVEAVLAGSASDPRQAVQLGRKFTAQDPARAAGYGQALIAALADVGEFKTAVEFVETAAASPLRLEQMNSAFGLWAQHQPEQAAAEIGRAHV